MEIFFMLLPLLVLLFVVMAIMRGLKVFAHAVDGPLRMPPLIGWSLLLVAAALNIFAYDVGFGIGYGIFGVCVMIAILLTFPKKKRTASVWFLATTGIVSCLLFGIRANEFVQIVNVCTALICAGALVLLHSIESVRWYGLWVLKMKAGFLAHIAHHPLSLKTMLRPSGGGMIPTILKTVGLTAVVLFFFATILSEADPVFSDLIGTVRDQTIGRVALSGVVLLLLLLGLSVSVSKKWQEEIPQMKIFSALELFIPALSLALLFGLFLGVQAKYLFATHADFQALDITYAEYVRQGFMELLVASFAGSIITYILILKQHAITEVSNILKLKWVNGVLLVELMLLLASAAKRDWMYMEIYGLTRVRLIGAIFLLWLLGVILLLLALNLLRSMQERRLIGGVAILSAVTVLALNALNIDAMIARSTPPRGASRDIVYISQLSTDAFAGWMEAITEANERFERARTKTVFSEAEKSDLADAKIAMAILEPKLYAITDARPWQEWNLSRFMTDRNQEPAILALCIRTGIRDLQSVTRTDLYQYEFDRLYGNSSPFMFENPTYELESLDSLNGVMIASSQPGTPMPASCR